MDNIYLIKDLAAITDLSIYTIKYYLKIGLIKEAGRSPETNFRYFNDSTVHLLRKIRELRTQKLSLKRIKDILSPHSSLPSEAEGRDYVLIRKKDELL